MGAVGGGGGGGGGGGERGGGGVCTCPPLHHAMELCSYGGNHT